MLISLFTEFLRTFQPNLAVFECLSDLVQSVDQPADADIGSKPAFAHLTSKREYFVCFPRVEL